MTCWKIRPHGHTPRESNGSATTTGPRRGQWRRIVVQIGADPHTRFPDVGAYYVMMREADIMARRFDRARVVYQCG
ncbi:DUF1963 domain-containing protein [Komagataeibacter sucrofermentans]|uniref:DUF1963 domain-containing protein n=1 Tax=Komagataeibacter sucrofermentans TaxID=1053551 RepID=UPI00142D1BE9|nr:DUF1963 domain-containing protein [Komagataeibacter sucrofermentans]